MMDHLSYEQRKDVISKIESTMKDLPLSILQSKLGDETFKKSSDVVILYQILKNSDSPSDAETHLAHVNSHNKSHHFKYPENYYESMHLTEILQEFKHFFYRRLHSGKVDYFAQMISEDLPRVITDASFKDAYQKLLFLALGDIYQQMASKCGTGAEERQDLLTQAESWISKSETLKHPSGFVDGGILMSASKSLLYYAMGDKDRAFDLCTQECDRVYSDLDNLHDLCHWSCAVIISANEADKFNSIDCNFVAAIGEKDLLVSPVSVILFIVIKCCRDEEQRCEFSKCFYDLQQWFPPQITYYKKELHKNHVLLKNILIQDGILQVTE